MLSNCACGGAPAKHGNDIVCTACGRSTRSEHSWEILMAHLTIDRPRPFAWSYSALNNFETCPKKFYEVQVAKNVKEPKGEALNWGDAVHAAMAKAVIHRSPLPPEMSKWQKWVDWARQHYDPNVM